MTQTTIISIEGQDKFSGVSAQAADAVNKLGSAVSSFPSAANAGISAAGGLAGAIGNMAVVAGGIVAAQVFNRIAEGITGFISTGLEAVGSSQMLESSLRSLMTANNMYAMSTDTVTVATTEQIMSQGDMETKARELNATLVTQKATFQEQAEKIRQLTDQYGDNGLVVIKNKGQHEELRLKIQDTERDIAGLTTSVTTYGTETKTSYTQVMSMADAQRIARRETDQLMDSISKIAVVSPFETQDVEMVARYAVAAGMGAKESETFTAGFLDMAAAVGILSPNLGFAADQLLQVKKVGKLTEIDLRQLRRMGIDLGKVIGVEMGMSVDEFNKKAETTPGIFDDMFDAINRFNQNTFAGTSKEMALSVKGIQSTVSDIFTIGARSFFQPLVDAASPAVADMVGKISEYVLGGSMSDIGKQAAKMLGEGFKDARAIFKAFGRDWGEGIRMALYKFGFSPETIAIAKNWIDDIKNIVSIFQTEGLFGAKGEARGGKEGGLLRMIGLSEESINAIESAFTTVKGLLGGFGESLSGLSGAGAIATLGSSLATLGTMTVDALNIAIPALVEFVTWLQTNIPLAIVSVTAAMTTVTTIFNQYWPIIQATVMTAWEVIQSVFAGIVAGSAPLMNSITQIGSVFSGMGITWSDVGNALLMATGIVFAGIGAIILGAISIVTALVSGVASAVSAMVAMWQSLVTSVTMIFTGWIVFMEGMGTAIKSIVSGDWTTAAQGFALAWEGVVIGVKGIISTILNLFSGLFATVIGFVGGFITSMVGFWQGLADELVGHSIIPDMIDKIIEIFTETDWLQLGEGIINGILKGINDNVTKVYEKIKEMAGTAISEAMSALGIQSPSTEFADIGHQIIAGLVQGITRGAPDFQGALDKLLNLSHVGTGFMDAFGQARDDIEKSMDEWLNPDKVEFALRAMSKMIKNNIAFAQIATDAQLEDMLMKSVGSWAGVGIDDPEKMVGDFVNILRDTQARLQQEAQAAIAENFNKMLGGIGQFASAASQEADALAKKISVLDTLLRQGGESFNVEGQIMNAAQAQERLNQLVTEQVAMQPDLAGITGFQAGFQNMQEQQALLAGLSTPVDQAAGDIVGGLNQLTGFLGQQIMAILGRQLGVPVGGTTSGTGGGGIAGGTQNNISFAPQITTVANEQSILQLFYQMMAMIPGGT